ncbi:SIP domain-containing protein [Curtobacterium sp. MCBA15_012]|uniref:SIP domain-containing protein n=1 Tax=Curtobacterium sp. MCBA15_012 TaxID=1898738 RepID=UPI0008DDC36F|nr:SIP domain-containing protein [Curtobacterium sp. MCBA15_012]WIB01646.1 SIP domain-containing protein [Curtobacterium sp. MCBA15_012]
MSGSDEHPTDHTDDDHASNDGHAPDDAHATGDVHPLGDLHTDQGPITDRVLVAGGLADLPEVRRILEELPDSAYGQVFVEVAFADEVRILPAPPHLTVTWLVRSDWPSTITTLLFADHGELLADAVTAWAAEWCVVGSEPYTAVWIGCVDSPWVERARSIVQIDLAATGQQVQVESGG